MTVQVMQTLAWDKAEEAMAEAALDQANVAYQEELMLTKPED
jgi:hypothetical protein